jgi:hypothetical protein
VHRTRYQDLVLDNREIIPISDTKFGVVVTDIEAYDLSLNGYTVRKVPQRKAGYYIEVSIGVRQRGSFDLAMLETSGFGDIVISPVPWRVGERYGTKAYLKSVSIASKETSEDRYDIAWRIWMWHSGIKEPEAVTDAANWMRKSEEELYPDDIKNRDALLLIADAAIEIGRRNK